METPSRFHTRPDCPEDLAGYHPTHPHGRGRVPGAHAGSPINLYPRVKTPAYQ